MTPIWLTGSVCGMRVAVEALRVKRPTAGMPRYDEVVCPQCYQHCDCPSFLIMHVADKHPWRVKGASGR